jgi:predicted NACHT family NTPase
MNRILNWLPEIFDRVISWSQSNPQVNIPLLSVIVALGSAVFGGFFTIVLWPIVKKCLSNVWRLGQDVFAKHMYQNTYLRHLINRFRHLPVLPTTLVPVTEHPSSPELDNLYVEVQVASGERSRDVVDVWTILKENPLLVVLGDPGAGKTTMIQFLTLIFARALRNQAADCGATDIAQERRRVQDARSTVQKMLGTFSYPLPIPVMLSRLKSATTWPQGKSILDSIQDELDLNDALRKLHSPKEFFQKYLDDRACIFLFDSFDELGSKEARDTVAQRIGELATTAPSGNRFIVTSRIIGYEGQLNQYGFKTVVIKPLSADRIKNLIEKWYGILGEPILADSLLQAMKNNRQLAELSVNPMLLSLIVLVQYVRRVIPDRRHVLYDECVKILVERRYAPVALQAEYNSVVPGEEALQILRCIAYTFHEQKLREMPRNELERDCIAKIISNMQFGRAGSVSPARVLKNIEERSQLLVERGLDGNGQPLMAFSHLTFQEFLSSVYLTSLWPTMGMANISEDIISTFEDDPEWWEEVALLYAAQLEGRQQRDFFERLRLGKRLQQ